MSDNLYFAAIIPPKDIVDKVIDIQRNFVDRFNSKRSLKVIPHITLKAPFTVPSDLYENVLKWFSLFVTNVKKFEQKLDGFGSFPNKISPVVFIKPVMNDSLVELQKQFLQHFLQYLPKELVAGIEYNYHPHMTVAYRDLTPANFRLAWNEYKSKAFKASFTVENFYLLQHDRKQWNIIATHPLL